ncbi:hypothetical protein B566_EDAN001021 [Ephemera danica]|nr:hypothetical protein B566_EDAN001021 [Ephemera danica]
MQDVHKQQEGELLVTSGDENAQLQQQVVRYVDDNGDIVEGVLAVVQEGEGTTVAVTPSGQVLQIQAAGETETYQLMEGPAESNNEGLVSGDLEPPTEQELAAADQEEEENTNKRSALEDADASAAKKMKVDDSN